MEQQVLSYRGMEGGATRGELVRRIVFCAVIAPGMMLPWLQYNDRFTPLEAAAEILNGFSMTWEGGRLEVVALGLGFLPIFPLLLWKLRLCLPWRVQPGENTIALIFGLVSLLACGVCLGWWWCGLFGPEYDAMKGFFFGPVVAWPTLLFLVGIVAAIWGVMRGEDVANLLLVTAFAAPLLLCTMAFFPPHVFYDDAYGYLLGLPVLMACLVELATVVVPMLRRIP